MIDEFDSQLQAKNEELKTLRRQLVERDSTIGKQIEQIDILNDNVENLTAKNEEKDRKMNEQDQVINTAWYVFGTKKELREQNILQKGDVMRSAEANKDYFTAIDIRVTKKYRFPQKAPNCSPIIRPTPTRLKKTHRDNTPYALPIPKNSGV